MVIDYICIGRYIRILPTFMHGETCVCIEINISTKYRYLRVSVYFQYIIHHIKNIKDSSLGVNCTGTYYITNFVYIFSRYLPKVTGLVYVFLKGHQMLLG